MYKNIALLFLILLSTSCQKKKIPVTFTTSEQKGRQIYQKNCLACHHPNPMEIGTIGPDLANSSFELVYKRVTSLEYPNGYKPKRKTQLMPEFKHLSMEDVQSLYDYINAFQKINN